MSCGSASADPNPYAGYTSTLYAGTANWLCHPDLAGGANVCNGDQTTIRVQADGSSTVERFTPAASPPFDCFYVYPTVSVDLALNSDLNPGAQERDTTLIQAARYGSVCRVFAPVYRQRTGTLLAIDALAPSLVSEQKQQQAGEIAYGDVLDAFKQYMAHENRGRGFVLVGHSQGSFLLARLIAEEIEPNPYLARHLIAAHIPGALVEAPIGTDVGGTFASTPACRSPDQTGCVIAYSSYRKGDPNLAEPVFGVASTPGMRALCVDPAALAGGAAALDAYLPFTQAPVYQLLLLPHGTGGPFADPSANRQAARANRFYSVPGQIQGQCVVNQAGTSYLEITISADPADPRADDYPGEFAGGKGWGLHLDDVSLAQGDLVRLAASEAAAWH